MASTASPQTSFKTQTVRDRRGGVGCVRALRARGFLRNSPQSAAPAATAEPAWARASLRGLPEGPAGLLSPFKFLFVSQKRN